MRYEGSRGRRGGARTLVIAVVVILAAIGVVSIAGWIIGTIWWLVRAALLVGLIALVVVAVRALGRSRR